MKIISKIICIYLKYGKQLDVTVFNSVQFCNDGNKIRIGIVFREKNKNSTKSSLCCQTSTQSQKSQK